MKLSKVIMIELLECEKIINHFLLNENIPNNEFYVAELITDTDPVISKSLLCVFIFPNKKVYLTAIKPNLSPNCIYLDSTFALKDYKTIILNKKIMIALAEAINNPLKLEALNNHFTFDENFNLVVDAQNQIVKSIKEKEILSKAINTNNLNSTSNIVNKI
jgi:hypothetical protein